MARRLFLFVIGAAVGTWATTPFAAFLAHTHPAWNAAVEALYLVSGVLVGAALAPPRPARARTRKEREVRAP